jgi:hypothetical protein
VIYPRNALNVYCFRGNYCRRKNQYFNPRQVSAWSQNESDLMMKLRVFPTTGAMPMASVAVLLVICSFEATGQDLVGHWRLDEGRTRSTADSSGNGNNGTLVGAGGPSWITGIVSNALRFDGKDEYVNVPSSPVFGITGDITLAAWIKREVPGAYDAVMAKTDGGTVWDYDIFFNDGDNRLTFWSDVASPISVFSTSEILDTNWHHIAVTRSGSDVTFYFDGIDAGTATMIGAFANNAVPVRIATDGPEYDEVRAAFQGGIDDVRIYNRALSRAEVQALNVTGTGAEIVVVGNGTSLMTGDTTPSFAEGTDFGVVEVPGGSSERTYTIYNFGTVNLTVGTVTISGPAAGDFQILTQPTSPVAGGGSTTFSIRFAPPTFGIRNATVSLANSDANENPFTFAIRGSGQSTTVVPGFLLREVYQNISGVLVSDLTNAAKYPNSPDIVEINAGFEAPIDVGSSFGQRLSGFLTPWETANYIFFVASDDQGELWLSSNEMPQNKVLIAREPEWNGSRDWIGTARRNAGAPENRSAPIHLEAGRRYYVEALSKEEGGGDNLAITAIKEGDPLPENGSGPLRGAFIGTFGVPTTNTVAFTTQPQSVTTTAGRNVAFIAAASSSANPIVYQWQKNGSNIFKANAPLYVTPPVTASDNLAQYRCIAYLSGGGSATSAVAALTIEADLAAPVVLRAHALADPLTGNASEVTVVFDEPVDMLSAEDPFNYKVNDVTVMAASLQPNLRNVVLTTDALLPNALNTLVIKEVSDRASAQNRIGFVTNHFRLTHLIARYGFDELNNLGADGAGANDGTTVGEPDVGAGQIRGALHFDNVNDYVVVPNSPSFGVTGDITIAAWIKRDNLSQYGAMVAKTDGANTWDYDLQFEDGETHLTFYSDTTTPSTVRSTGEILDSEWHHIAVTRSGSSVTFYIDGANAGSTTMSGNFPNNPTTLRVGTDGPAWSSSSMFHGWLDDVRIYNAALSAAQIQMIRSRPQLSIMRSGSSVAISWPTAATDYLLECTDNLSSGNWNTVAGEPEITGGQNTLQFGIGSAAKFYRLKE